MEERRTSEEQMPAELWNRLKERIPARGSEADPPKTLPCLQRCARKISRDFGRRPPWQQVLLRPCYLWL